MFECCFFGFCLDWESCGIITGENKFADFRKAKKKKLQTITR